MQRLTRFFLWAITGVTLTLLMYPNIAAHERTSRPKSAAEMTGHSAAYAIPSMDCPACATIIEKRLQEKPGILFAHVDFAAKRAVIRFNPQEVTPGYIRTVIEETGLPARLIKVVGQEQKSD